MTTLPLALRALSPEVLLIAAGGIIALLSARGKGLRWALGYRLLAMSALVLAACALRWVVPNRDVFGGRLTSNSFIATLGLVILGGALLVVLASFGERWAAFDGRRLPLLLWIVGSGLLMLRAQDLVSIAGAFAVASLGVAGWPRRDESHRQEQFTQAAMAVAAILLATAILYGETGATQFGPMTGAFALGLTGSTALGTLGLVLLAVALVWRAGLVPFHRHGIEILESNRGLESPAVPFLQSTLRILGLLLFARVLSVTAYAESLPRLKIVLVLGAASMMMGALVAVARKDLRGIAGYLILAHLGMAVLPLASPAPQLLPQLVGVLYAAATTIAATIAAHLALRHLDLAEGTLGAGRRQPMAAGVFLLALAALAGLPGTSGFGCAWIAGQWALRQDLPYLAAAVLACCLLGFFLTLRIGRDLFSEVSTGDRATTAPPRAPNAGPSTQAPRLALLAASAALLAGGGAFLLRLMT